MGREYEVSLDGWRSGSLMELNGDHDARDVRHVLGNWVVGVPFSIMGMIGKGAHWAREIRDAYRPSDGDGM